MRIAMIGTGYVGLVSGACFADFGHHVICVDKDAGQDRGAEARRRCRSSSRASPSWWRTTSARAGSSFTTELAEAGARGRRGVHRGRHAVAARRRPCRPELRLSPPPREIAAALDGFTVVVTKSTVPVGTGDEVEAIIRERRPDAEFAVVSNPEFLREGAAIDDFKHPDRIVVGTERRARARGDGASSIGRSISTRRRSSSPAGARPS